MAMSGTDTGRHRRYSIPNLLAEREGDSGSNG